MSKAAFGHSKSTIAMCDGSMERSLIPSGVALKSASSIRLEMAPIKFLNNRASFIVALNKAGFAVPSFLLVVSANELSNIGLTILSPGCPAVRTKLQNVFSSERGSLREFILYPAGALWGYLVLLVDGQCGVVRAVCHLTGLEREFSPGSMIPALS